MAHGGEGVRASVGTGAPTIVTSRRRQRELLRSWSGWPLTLILFDPTEVARVREAGWSGTHHSDPDTGQRIVGTPVGLGFDVDGSWHNPVEVIPWSEIEAIAGEVPHDVREDLVEFRARWGVHQSAYPRFTASADAVGCGPIIARPAAHATPGGLPPRPRGIRDQRSAPRLGAATSRPQHGTTGAARPGARSASRGRGHGPTRAPR